MTSERFALCHGCGNPSLPAEKPCRWYPTGITALFATHSLAAQLAARKHSCVAGPELLFLDLRGASPRIISTGVRVVALNHRLPSPGEIVDGLVIDRENTRRLDSLADYHAMILSSMCVDAL